MRWIACRAVCLLAIFAVWVVTVLKYGGVSVPTPTVQQRLEQPDLYVMRLAPTCTAADWDAQVRMVVG